MAYRPAIASLSLGRACVHQIAPKFTAAAHSGFPGIEIFYEDLVYLASSFPGGLTDSNQILAAHQIRRLSDSLHLEIIALGPFLDCEGVLDQSARAAKLEELNLWFELARILRTDIIQIPCTIKTEGFTGDLDVVARDLREIADIGAAQNPPFRFTYENLCFGAFNDTWEKAWAVVEAVDRDNFGMCLDTFNIAGRGWADPASPTGRIENADEVFRASMKNMAKTMDVKKVFYVQIVDAERMDSPLIKGHPLHVDGQKPRMNWSRNCRLFMCEEDRGAYLPVMDVLKAICDEKEGLGYKGWISMELFNRSLFEEGNEVPTEHANRATLSWKRVVKAMGWEKEQSLEADRRVSPKEVKGVEISARL